MSGKAYILGSGVSRAINEYMPTVTELSDAVVDDIHAKGLPAQAPQRVSRRVHDCHSTMCGARPTLSSKPAPAHRGCGPMLLCKRSRSYCCQIVVHQVRHRDHVDRYGEPALRDSTGPGCGYLQGRPPRMHGEIAQAW